MVADEIRDGYWYVEVDWKCSRGVLAMLREHAEGKMWRKVVEIEQPASLSIVAAFFPLRPEDA